MSSSDSGMCCGIQQLERLLFRSFLRFQFFGSVPDSIFHFLGIRYLRHVNRSTRQIEMQVTIVKNKLPEKLLFNSHLLHFFKRRFFAAGLCKATAPVNNTLTRDDIDIQPPENQFPVDKPASCNKAEN